MDGWIGLNDGTLCGIDGQINHLRSDRPEFYVSKIQQKEGERERDLSLDIKI